jgi:hypothetical protein
MGIARHVRRGLEPLKNASEHRRKEYASEKWLATSVRSIARSICRDFAVDGPFVGCGERGTKNDGAALYQLWAATRSRISNNSAAPAP